MNLPFLAWFAIALAGWFCLSLLIGWLMGRIIRETTGQPPSRELCREDSDLLDLSEATFDWPDRNAA